MGRIIKLLIPAVVGAAILGTTVGCDAAALGPSAAVSESKGALLKWRISAGNSCSITRVGMVVTPIKPDIER